MSQPEFSNVIKLPQTSLSQYERGHSRVPADIISSISKHFNVNLNWLLTGEGEMFTRSLSHFDRSSRNNSLTSISQNTDNDSSSSAWYYIQFVALKPDCSITEFDRERDLEILGSIRIPKDVMDPSFVGAELVRHYGQEMEPKIHHKDLIAYVPGPYEGSGNYVLKKGSIATVRLVYMTMDGAVILKCENEKFQEERFGKDYEQYFQILGRVIAGLHVTKM